MCSPDGPQAGSRFFVHPHRPLTRRAALGGAGTGLLIAGLGGTLTGTAASADGARATGARRTSRLTQGTTLVHADLHNHTLISDGDGDPDLAYDSMRDAGLDVAALTDHATISDSLLASALAALLPEGYSQLGGLTRQDWARTKELADAADADGTFTAIRGFEWSEPLLGHINVWFSEHYTDIVDIGAMRPFFSWLTRSPNTPLIDGGADGIAGFNHPGREFRRFQDFRYFPGARDQMVSLEMFNRRDDYLFEGYADGRTSPLNECLNAGWRTGITGVTDEHGTDWGFPEGKGRTGLWVDEHSRSGVMRAMRARRFFATRTSGLRVDATATVDRQEHRMGSVIPASGGDVRFALDLARDDEWQDRTLAVQVLRPGTEVPEVVAVQEFRVGDVVRFTVPLDEADGEWVLLRISDPSQPNPTPGPDGHPCNDLGIAYTSPWWFDPA